ncbi:hypothetical protein L873DRAFT_90927 [Choiromyces venosus 120613-1]|uniref:Uncharacterized protein n=1 Tax=Choiromyces venosus 120613-1 TaxID=1336337 RepID=A0A3N4KCL2_9PEZI|nr:hypothetical protein L873DRAFT_90927 [Choiromyces venosus 120613-1]
MCKAKKPMRPKQTNHNHSTISYRTSISLNHPLPPPSPPPPNNPTKYPSLPNYPDVTLYYEYLFTPPPPYSPPTQSLSQNQSINQKNKKRPDPELSLTSQFPSKNKTQNKIPREKRPPTP